MSTFAKQLKAVVPPALDMGIRIAVENHCDSFSEEILWVLDQVDHPSVGACIDTVNALHVMEDPMAAIRNLVWKRHWMIWKRPWPWKWTLSAEV